jgi:Fe-S-cluster containining protein
LTPEWFERVDPATGAAGLRFSCTMCGNCCSGPPGYVSFTEEEAAAMAARLGVTLERFMDEYTHDTMAGRSLKEVPSTCGLDCIFLDRTTIPGRAICGVYEDRPAQCRTWPFWDSNLKTEKHWKRAGQTCPGLNKGTLYTPQQIRIIRAEGRA